jgi:hypothetical protein
LISTLPKHFDAQFFNNNATNARVTISFTYAEDMGSDIACEYTGPGGVRAELSNKDTGEEALTSDTDTHPNYWTTNSNGGVQCGSALAPVEALRCGFKKQ